MRSLKYQCVCVCSCVYVCTVVYREVGFRKRAQSADDDGSVELAESLQHLTLSEFLKEYVWGRIRPFVAPSVFLAAALKTH